MIIHSHEGCLKKSELCNQGGLNEFGPWLRAASPTCRAERNRGGHAPKSGRNFLDNHSKDGRSCQWASGSRREDDRSRAGEEDSDDGGKHGGIFKESNNFSPIKDDFVFNGKKAGGEASKVNVDAQTGKESNLDNNHGVTGDQAGGFPSKEKTSIEHGKLWETINDKDFPVGRCQVLNKERGDKAQRSRRASSYDNMGFEARRWASRVLYGPETSRCGKDSERSPSL